MPKEGPAVQCQQSAVAQIFQMGSSLACLSLADTEHQAKESQ